MAKKFDFLSPGVEIREIDQSFIPAQVEAEGPIIIGRTRKGPANKPVKVSNLDDFVSVFGLPVPGGNGAQGDIWREGNTVGPTYASYAAQAWLASEQSPVTMVRIAGEQHSQATTGLAGWEVGANGIGTDGNNSTAYGLFLVDESKVGTYSHKTLEFVSSYTYTSSSLDGKSLTGSVNSADVFEILFDATTTVPAAGAAEVTNASATPPVITAYFSGSATKADGVAVLNAALQLAIDSGYADLVIADSSTSLEIYNRESTVFGLHYNDTNVLNLGTEDINTERTIAAFSGTEASAGSLAAVFYCVTGALALSGALANGGSATASAGALIESAGSNKEFKLSVYGADGSLSEDISFNFSKGTNSYIRNQFNTNPQLTNSTIVESADLKTYWLGESFLDHLESNVTSTAAGTTYGILLPLGSGITKATNWGYHKYSAREAKSGWVFSNKATNEKKLFRFKSMHVGEEIQKNYVIVIEDISAPKNLNVNAFGSFTVTIKDMSGNTVERYTGCNLNPASPDYIAARIGDQYQSWSDSDKRYRTYGDFKNQSDIIYVEMNDNISNGGGQGLLPAGFFGPVRPKGFSLIASSAQVSDLDGNTDFTGSVVRSGDSSALYFGQTGEAGAIADLGSVSQAKFEFPKMRMRVNGSDGGASNQARSYWGIRPKISAQSNQNDPDFIDYTRALGMGLGEEGTHTPGTDYEYSFIFSLDDVSGSVETGTWSWASGNYDSNLSYSKANSFSDLLDKNVRQFVMPLWGGSEGFDITEMEPLRNTLVAQSGLLNETTSYVDYSISKALDCIADSEVVPANLLLMPGISKEAATNKMVNIAESRKDVLAILDLEGDYVPRVESKDSASSRLGSVTEVVTNTKNRSFNSSYACAFFPWVQISDNLNANNLVWIPSSVAALGAFGKSQAQSDVWFAPAGFNRGGLGYLGGQRGPKVLQARQRLDSKERDVLYEVNINPIATFPAEGVVIFGQKTLQADGSALDRINVRRLLLFLKARVSDVSRNLLFDQNVQSTWNRFKSEVNPILSDVKARFGLADYKLILDETTTTADLVDRNIMYAKIYVKPARAIEYIVVDFVITRTGADFV